MSKEIISTPNGPAAVGPYSQAVAANGLVFVSGQLGLDPKSGQFAAEDVVGQAHQVFKNVQAILEAKGLTLKNVVKTTLFLTDIADFAKVNEVYAEYFQAPYPARSAFQICALPKGGLVELEVIAAI
ncbi:RidA family protein [Porphyromonas somerae]|uniref:RidA family protein n=1 Tax=Porphyromonas somerae TaxID=322095 RepID=UPI002A82E6A5|nr:RidA family protein [Porphyromonas somerae]MDY3883960.1 RidA family protein [Porphyromonas somerae]